MPKKNSKHKMATEPFSLLPSFAANCVQYGSSPNDSENSEKAGKERDPDRKRRRDDFMSKIRFKSSDDALKIVSKTVSWVLRHGAKETGIEMDDDRYVKVKDLMDMVKKAGVDLENFDHLVDLLQRSNEGKKRYSFSDEDGDDEGDLKIKATYKFDTLPGTNTKVSGVRDSKWADSASGRRNYGEGKGYGAAMPYEKRLIVCNSEYFEKVIIRAEKNINSQQIGKLNPGDIVVQEGEEITIEDEIVRIMVRDDNQGGVSGWVTKDARKADGPLFLEEYRGIPFGELAHGGGYGSGGKDDYRSKGYGKDDYDYKGKKGKYYDDFKGDGKGGKDYDYFKVASILGLVFGIP